MISDPFVDPGSNPVVVYGIKELLAEIRDDVKESKRMLDSKVDKADHIVLEARVQTLEALKWKAVGFLFGAAIAGGTGGAALSRLIA